MELFSKGDFDGVGGTLHRRRRGIAAGVWLVKGRSAIAAMWKGMAEQVIDPKVTALDVKMMGPSTAREIGTFSLKTKGTAPKEVTGKYVVVWEKVGAEWKLATDIWNDGK